jgi:hypothetical protein
MRHAMPVRWIEQAEARRVIATALLERAPEAPCFASAGDAAAQWLPRLGSWLVARHPMVWAVAPAQPAMMRRPAGRPTPLSHDRDAYSADW